MAVPDAQDLVPDQPLFGIDPEVIVNAVGVANNLVVVSRGAPGYEIVWANRFFFSFTGYSPEEVIGQNCRLLQMLPDGTRDGAQPGRFVVSEAIENEEPVHVLLRNYKKDGTLFWNDLYVTPVMNAQGAVTHFVGVQNDVTDRVEAQHQVGDTLWALQATEARTQAQIGRDLHDGLGQILTGVNLAAGSLLAKLQEEGSPHAAAAATLQAIVARATKEAVRLSTGVSPVPSGPEGLSSALRDLVGQVGVATSQQVTLEGRAPVGDPVVARSLFRMVQEAVTNAIRHSEGTEIGIRQTALENGGIRIEIEDDGVGVPSERTGRAVDRKGHYGLTGLWHRADSVGARLRFEALKQDPQRPGTRVTIEWVPEEAGAEGS